MNELETNFSQFTLGSYLGSRYILEECIGVGGMGWVFRATDTALDDHVIALKVFYPHLVRSVDTQQFEGEALTSRRLSHPRVVQVYNYHRLTGDIAVMTMEFVRGTTLAQHILAPANGVEIPMVECITQIVDGLAYAHRSGVLHRDIKAENILVTEEPSCKIADFGIAQLLAEASSLQSQKFAGTPAYMSPEQFNGEVLTPASDVYSFGILLYFMLHRQTPFRGKTVFEMAEQHLLAPLHYNKEILRQYPQWVSDLLLRCTEKQPEQRFASMDEVASYIEVAHGYAFTREESVSDFSFAKTEPSPLLADVDEQARPVLRSLLILHAIGSLVTGLMSIFSDEIGYRIGFVVISFHALGLLCRRWLRWTATTVAFLVSLAALAYFNPWSRVQVMFALLHLEESTGVELFSIKRALGYPLRTTQPDLVFDFKIDSELLKMLISSPLPLTTESPLGENFLHRLSGRLPDNVAAALLDADLKIDARDRRGRTPLFRMVEEGEEWLIDFLLLSGADVNIPDSLGRTALSVALERDLVRVTKRLACYQARADGRSYAQRELTIFEQALQRQNPEVVACLLLNHPYIESAAFARWLSLAKSIRPAGRHSAAIVRLIETAQKHPTQRTKAVFESEVGSQAYLLACDCESLYRSHAEQRKRIEQYRRPAR